MPISSVSFTKSIESISCWSESILSPTPEDLTVEQFYEQLSAWLVKQGYNKDTDWAWQRKEGKNPKGGLNAKGRASAKAQGMNLKPPVKAAEAKKSPKAAGRRKSFCGRMCGMKSKLTSAKTARDPNSRINKSLRAWDCSCK